MVTLALRRAAPHLTQRLPSGWCATAQALVDKLGRMFEPYVIHILPMLLACFGDGDAGVRDATDAASRAIMSHLSGQGAPSSNMWTICEVGTAVPPLVGSDVMFC